MRAFAIFTAITLLVEGKNHKREANQRSLRKTTNKESPAPKRRLDDVFEPEELSGFRYHALADLGISGPDGVIAQVASTITGTGQELLDTAIRGNKLLQADAKITLGNAVEPIIQNIQEDTRRITGTTKALAESLGLDTIRDDAKKVIVAAADVVRQGEQNLTAVLRNFTSSIISRQ